MSVSGRNGLPLVLVAAVARNRVIGVAGALPWHIPEDLAHFRRHTMGRPMVMGRKTFLSLGRVLDGRPHVVMTRDPDWPTPEGVDRAGSLTAALQVADRRGVVLGSDAIAVIGGEAVFEAALPLANRLLLTEVDLAPAGDARFPAIDPLEWPASDVGDWRRSGAEGKAYRPAYRFVERRRAGQ